MGKNGKRIIWSELSKSMFVSYATSSASVLSVSCPQLKTVIEDKLIKEPRKNDWYLLVKFKIFFCILLVVLTNLIIV